MMFLLQCLILDTVCPCRLVYSCFTMSVWLSHGSENSSDNVCLELSNVSPHTFMWPQCCITIEITNKQVYKITPRLFARDVLCTCPLPGRCSRAIGPSPALCFLIHEGNAHKLSSGRRMWIERWQEVIQQGHWKWPVGRRCQSRSALLYHLFSVAMSMIPGRSVHFIFL